jgi:glyoxylase-like metal-dependent hydrolase (beta-lactamase superfamily II)
MATKEEYLKVKKELDGSLAKEKASLKSRLQTIEKIEQFCKLAEAIVKAFGFDDEERPEYPCLARSKYRDLDVIAIGEGAKEGCFEGIVLVGCTGHTKGSICDRWRLDSFTFEPL